MAQEKRAKTGQGSRKASEADEAIGRNLRQLRLGAGLSQQDVAEVLEVTFQQVQKYESGANRLSLAMLLRLRGLYGISYERFFAGIEGKTGDQALAPLFPDYDDQTMKLCHRLATIEDRNLRKKIGRIIEVLATE